MTSCKLYVESAADIQKLKMRSPQLFGSRPAGDLRPGQAILPAAVGNVTSSLMAIKLTLEALVALRQRLLRHKLTSLAVWQHWPRLLVAAVLLQLIPLWETLRCSPLMLES